MEQTLSLLTDQKPQKSVIPKAQPDNGSFLFATPLLEKLSSYPVPYTDIWSNEELLEYFTNAWQMNDLLFSSIMDESSFYENPDPLRNPLIFYLGHTPAFYINKLKAVGLIDKGINPHYEVIFEIGVDPEKPEEISSNISSTKWPSVEEVWAYRKQAFQLIYDKIKHTTIHLTIQWNGPLWAFLMGVEHDRIHFETSSVLIRQLEVEKVKKPAGWNYADSQGKSPTNEMISVPAGKVILGKPIEYPTYGWDNEYGRREVAVQAFQATQNLISNGEFLEFVEANGYGNQKFWDEESWNWKLQHQIEHPKFWKKSGNEYQYRAMFDYLDLPLDWPVEVNHYEAMAYCRWKGDGTRLMSESEWNHISGDHSSEEQRFDRKNDVLFSNDWNLNVKYGSPNPVGSLPTAQTALGFNDVYGNVWEWLSDDFYPLPGFRTHDLYKNFSIPYFDTHHKMMLGGSWATTGTGASKFYRLWFRKYFYQHAGFRTAKDL